MGPQFWELLKLRPGNVHQASMIAIRVISYAYLADYTGLQNLVFLCHNV